MMRGHGLTVFLAGIAAVSIASGASAQTGKTNQPYQPNYGHNGGGGGQPYIRQVPPPLLMPGSSGLLEQGFQQMRQTSPRPNQFMGGRWNPSYETVRPPIQYQPYPNGGYYYPPVYGNGYYNGYYGNGYYNNGYYNGGGYPYGYGGNNTIIQREVYVYPQQNQQQAQPDGNVTRPQTEPKRPTKGSGGEFYLQPGEAETLTAALDDVRKAWLNGDFDRFQARLRTEGKLKIFAQGQLRSSLDGKQFGAMVKDAMAKIDTVALEFDRPKPQEGGAVFVSGKHTFVDSNKQKQSTYISYMLEKVGGKWKITEAGSSSEPIIGPAAG